MAASIRVPRSLEKAPIRIWHNSFRVKMDSEHSDMSNSSALTFNLTFSMIDKFEMSSTDRTIDYRNYAFVDVYRDGMRLAFRELVPLIDPNNYELLIDYYVCESNQPVTRRLYEVNVDTNSKRN